MRINFKKSNGEADDQRGKLNSLLKIMNREKELMTEMACSFLVNKSKSVLMMIYHYNLNYT